MPLSPRLTIGRCLAVLAILIGRTITRLAVRSLVVLAVLAVLVRMAITRLSIGRSLVVLIVLIGLVISRLAWSPRLTVRMTLSLVKLIILIILIRLTISRLTVRRSLAILSILALRRPSRSTRCWTI